jgi:GTPase SAR1 family protein
VVYDITCQETFDNMSKWIKLYKDVNGPEFSDNIVILGNKSDLKDERKVTYEAGE